MGWAEMDAQTLVALLASGSSVILGWAGFFASRRRDTATMTTRLAAMQASLDSCNEKLDDMTHKLGRMQDDYSGMASRVSKIETYCEGIQRQHNELVDRVARLEKQAGYRP